MRIHAFLAAGVLLTAPTISVPFTFLQKRQNETFLTEAESAQLITLAFEDLTFQLTALSSPFPDGNPATIVAGYKNLTNTENATEPSSPPPVPSEGEQYAAFIKNQNLVSAQKAFTFALTQQRIYFAKYKDELVVLLKANIDRNQQFNKLAEQFIPVFAEGVAWAGASLKATIDKAIAVFSK